MTRSLLLSLFFLLVPSLAVSQTIQVCNDYSVLPGKACTGAGDCPDADAADAGAGACVAVIGGELDICNTYSLNPGMTCFSNDANCPDISPGDAGQGACGVLVSQDASLGISFLYRYHPAFGSRGSAVLTRQALESLAQRLPLSDTNCRANVTTAVLNQLCSDTALWKCVNPSLAGGASAIRCDQTAEWGAVQAEASTPTIEQVLAVSAVGGEVLINNAGRRILFGNADTEGEGVCIARGTDYTSNSQCFWNDPTDGAKSDVDPDSDYIVTIPSTKSALFKNASAATLWSLSESGTNKGFTKILCEDATDINVVNTTTQTTLLNTTCTIPGGALGTRGCAELVVHGEILTNDGGDDPLDLVLQYGSGSVTRTVTPGASSVLPYFLRGTVCNTGTTNAQHLQLDGMRSTTQNLTSEGSATQDSTVDQTIDLEADWDTSSANLRATRFHSYLILNGQ